jgi:hypothetical protein
VDEGGAVEWGPVNGVANTSANVAKFSIGGVYQVNRFRV